jgi:WD40 repeat protein
MSAVAAPPASPFKGLSAFDDSDLDALFFFGREREREVIVANLLASRLTVLYGESGVGKSSVLRAGVLRELRRVEPGAFVALHDTWSAAPSVSTLVDACAAGSGYLILDQLEEYFVYHAHEDGPGTLLHDLPELLRETRVNVLLSLREDALAQLDVFKARIPNVFANQLRLEHLDPEAARAAVLGPVERWNELTGEHVAVEQPLVAAVLDEVAAGKVDLGGAGLGVVDGAARAGRIEAPYLQLVLERIWEAERRRGSSTLRLATLRGLGGAEAIVRAHVETALDELVPAEKDVAAQMFDHLVTPSGTKIAQRAADLAQYAAVPEELVRPVLASLNRERILRTVDGAGGGGERYEIFHDVLAEPVLAWRGRRQLERERFEAARRSRRLLAVTLASLLALLAVAAIAAFGLSQRNSARAAAHHAHARELQATALQQLAVDPEQSLLLALDAARLEPSSAAEDVLRQALLTSRLRLVLPAGKPVDAVAYSPDGKQIATGSTDGRVRIHDAASGALIRVLRGSGRILAVAYSPDGAELLTAGDGTEAVLRNARTGAVLVALRTTAPISSAAFSPHGTVVVTSLDAAARIWRARDGKLLQTLRTGGDPSRARVSPDGSLVAVIAADPAQHVRARIYDAHTGRLLHVLPEKGITDVEFSPDGSLLATTSADDTTRLWEPRSGRLVRLLDDGGGTVLAASFSPDGKLLATAGEDGAVRVWTVADGTRLFFFPSHTGFVVAVAWSPDGHVLASASVDRTVRLWAVQGLVASGTLVAVLAGHGDGVNAVAFSPDGRRLVSGSTDGTARVWDARAQQELDLLGRSNGEVVRAGWSPDGTLAVSADADGTARVWTVKTRALLRVLHHGVGAVNDAEFSPDGKLIVTAGADGTARIWDFARGLLVHTLAHGAPVSVASFDPSGHTVVTAGTDGVARVWDARTGRQLAALRGHGALADAAFSPDGTLLATGSTKGAIEWSLPSGRPLHALPLSGGVTRVVFSPDGKLLATAGSDPVVRLWDASSGRLVHALRGHRAAVTDVEFSRDGTTLATSSADTDGRLWDVASGTPLHVLRGHFGPVAAIGLSPDGHWVATAGPISAGLWPTATGQLLFYLRGHTSLLTSISFAPDGWRILSSSRDGTVRVYTCDACGNLQALVTLAEQRLERTAHALTPAQRARYLPRTSQ